MVRRGRIEEKEYWADFQSICVKARNEEEAIRKGKESADKYGIEIEGVERVEVI